MKNNHSPTEEMTMPQKGNEKKYLIQYNVKVLIEDMNAKFGKEGVKVHTARVMKMEKWYFNLQEKTT